MIAVSSIVDIAGRLVLVVVEPGQVRGQALDRRLELGVGVEEVAQPLGHPLQRHRLVTPALDQFLDAAVGEVHVSPYAERFMRGGIRAAVYARRGRAASTTDACSASCSLAEPTAGAAAAGREIRRTGIPSRCSSRFSVMKVHAPWLAGSSCTQT